MYVPYGTQALLNRHFLDQLWQGIHQQARDESGLLVTQQCCSLVEQVLGDPVAAMKAITEVGHSKIGTQNVGFGSAVGEYPGKEDFVRLAPQCPLAPPENSPDKLLFYGANSTDSPGGHDTA